MAGRRPRTGDHYLSLELADVAEVTEDTGQDQHGGTETHGEDCSAGGTPACGRRQSEALIPKHTHHSLAWCLCFGISASLNRA